MVAAPHACLADNDEIPFCEIASPSRFPNLYELSNALPLATGDQAETSDEADSDDDDSSQAFGEEDDGVPREKVEVPPGTEVSFLYTGRGDPVALDATDRLVQQPNLTALSRSATSSVDQQVG